MSPAEITQRIAAALEDGKLSRREAEVVLGFVLLESVVEGDMNRPELDSPLATFYRRCRALRKLGLLRVGPTEPVEVEW